MSRESEGAPSHKRSSRGFTLIEIAVVVVIIAVLAALAVPAYQRSVERSKATEAATVLNKIRSEQEKMAAFSNTYADNFSQLSPVIQGKRSSGTSIDSTNYTYHLRDVDGIKYAEAVPKSKYEYTIRTSLYNQTNLCAEGDDADLVKNLFKGCDLVCDDIVKAKCTSTGGSWTAESCSCTCEAGKSLVGGECIANPKECPNDSSKPLAECGNCGTRLVECDKSSGEWKAGACQNEGECAPGTPGTVENGSKTCSASCSWTLTCNSGYTAEGGKCVSNGGGGEEDDKTCGGTGECTAGETEEIENGTRTCSSTCKWEDPVCSEGYEVKGSVCEKKTPAPATCASTATVVQISIFAEDTCDGNIQTKVDPSSMTATCVDIYPAPAGGGASEVVGHVTRSDRMSTSMPTCSEYDIKNNVSHTYYVGSGPYSGPEMNMTGTNYYTTSLAECSDIGQMSMSCVTKFINGGANYRVHGLSGGQGAWVNNPTLLDLPACGDGNFNTGAGREEFCRSISSAGSPHFASAGGDFLCVSGFDPFLIGAGHVLETGASHIVNCKFSFGYTEMILHCGGAYEHNFIQCSE
ncbi:prepilin-type N-terminal cleavage/methylation domain-containing protein [Parelusimicrobium proximum]|uniref:prepilin-type N-terminal cleavage/methylation domain-containing protein n=1 Tax=Parelusimicrobium proximum TaxID=3228953 RepID=UPI003D177DF0